MYASVLGRPFRPASTFCVMPEECSTSPQGGYSHALLQAHARQAELVLVGTGGHQFAPVDTSGHQCIFIHS